MESTAQRRFSLLDRPKLAPNLIPNMESPERIATRRRPSVGAVTTSEDGSFKLFLKDDTGAILPNVTVPCEYEDLFVDEDPIPSLLPSIDAALTGYGNREEETPRKERRKSVSKSVAESPDANMNVKDYGSVADTLKSHKRRQSNAGVKSAEKEQGKKETVKESEPSDLTKEAQEMLNKLSAGDRWVVTENGSFKLVSGDEEVDLSPPSSGGGHSSDSAISFDERKENEVKKEGKKSSDSNKIKKYEGKAAENHKWTKDLRAEIATLALRIGKSTNGAAQLEQFGDRLHQGALEQETLAQLQDLHFRLESIERSL